MHFPCNFALYLSQEMKCLSENSELDLPQESKAKSPNALFLQDKSESH